MMDFRPSPVGRPAPLRARTFPHLNLCKAHEDEVFGERCIHFVSLAGLILPEGDAVREADRLLDHAHYHFNPQSKSAAVQGAATSSAQPSRMSIAAAASGRTTISPTVTLYSSTPLR